MKSIDFEPGVWGLSWDDALNGNGAQGVVSFSNEMLKLDITIGLLLGDSFVHHYGQKQNPDRAEKLYGFTRDGHCIVLYDAVSRGASSSIPGMEHQDIHAKCLFARKGGAPFDIDGQVDKMTLSLQGLRNWVGESVFSMKLDERFAFSSLEVMGDARSRNITLLDDDSLRVEVFHTYTTPALTVDDMTFKHDCRLEVVLKDGAPWRDAVDIAQRVSRFFTLCMGFDASIDALELHFEGQEKPARFYQRFVEGKNPSKQQLNQIPFPYACLKDSVEGMIGAWLHAPFALRKAQDMLVSQMVLDWRMPIDIEMVARSQLIEALSKHNIDLHAMPEDEHAKKMGELERALSNVDKQTACRVLSMFKQNRKGQSRLLKELLQRHGDYVKWLIPNPEKYLKDHTSMRNATTHSDFEHQRAPEELFDHVQASLLLAYGIVLSILGLKSEFIIDRIQKSRFKYWVVEDAQRRYS